MNPGEKRIKLYREILALCDFPALLDRVETSSLFSSESVMIAEEILDEIHGSGVASQGPPQPSYHYVSPFQQPYAAQDEYSQMHDYGTDYGTGQVQDYGSQQQGYGHSIAQYGQHDGQSAHDDMDNPPQLTRTHTQPEYWWPAERER